MDSEEEIELSNQECFNDDYFSQQDVSELDQTQSEFSINDDVSFYLLQYTTQLCCKILTFRLKHTLFLG